MTTRWDTAQVCLAGHLVNSEVRVNPGKNADFCAKCGEETIAECPACNKPIRGYSHDTRTHTGYPPRKPPAFCHACGKPYPWTERKAAAVMEMIDELEGLSADEKAKLKKSIPDIIAETPNSDTAVLRFKKAIAKVGQAGGQMLTKVLTDVAAEAVKKSMGL